MCVKFPPGDLNPGLCPQQPTSIYTCRVTIASRVYGGKFSHSLMRDIYIRI